MVFKKPYAFLIKNFKKIHIALAVFLIYLAIKIYQIVRFFGNYASSGYYDVVSNIAGSYVNFFMYLAVIVVLCILVFVYMLMKNKKKSTKLYVASIIYYLLVFILLSVTYGILSGLEKATADIQMARVYRDVSLLLSLPQYFFIIYTLIRGLGFDIKKFNFQLDLKEMEIEAKDNEEIELTVGVETYKAKRYVHRMIREFKYYILENTFIFICILSILGIIIGTGIFLNVNVYNKVYKEDKVFTYKSFNLKINESYLTNKGYQGNVIVKDKYYLVLNVNVVNNYTTQNKLKLTDFRLKIGNENIYPTKNKMEYFTDLGKPYKEDKINGESNDNYLLIYELDKSQVQKNYIIKVLDSIEYKVGDIQAKYKDVKVEPIKLDEIIDTKDFKIKDKVVLKGSLLDNSTVKINEYSIETVYKYKYDFCIANECRVSTGIVTPDYSIASPSLLVLDYELSLDKNTSYYKEIKKDSLFFKQFAKVRTTKNKKTTTYNIKDLTPNDIKNKVVLQVDSDIKQADSIELLITIRNKEYIVKLK